MNNETENDYRYDDQNAGNNDNMQRPRFSLKEQFFLFPVTMTIIAVTGIIFLVLNLERYIFHGTALLNFLAPNKILVFNGSYWGILTCQLVHIDIIHWAFNMYIIYFLGRSLEKFYGRKFYLLLILFSSLAAAAANTLLSDVTGIGFSGVLCGFVGFELVKYIPPASGQNILTKRNLHILIIWLSACIILSFLNIFHISNAALFGGLAGGLLAGAGKRYIKFQKIFKVLIGLTALFAAVQVFYSPWSEIWVNRGFYQKFLDFDENAGISEENSEIAYNRLVFGEDSAKEDALQYLQRAVQSGDLHSMNNLAWFYATTSDLKYRNGEEAVKLAETVCRKTNYANYMYVDTLAAAYARSKNWEKAVKYQESAIKLLNTSNSGTDEGFEQRLELYRNSIPCTVSYN